MDDRIACQILTIPKVSISKAGDYHPNLKKFITRIFSRHLSPRFKRQLKMLLFEPRQWFRKHILKQKHVITEISTAALVGNSLKSGDVVRVRSREEIMATLDRWGQLKGCSFMEEMQEYSGTIQEVFKPVRRFVDERDQNVKRTKGVVLLKNVFCLGTSSFGPCDRSCLYFWREEWLDKLQDMTQ